EKINISLATHVLLVSHSNLAAARSDGLLPLKKGTVLGSGSVAGIDLDHFSLEQFNEKAQKTARVKFGIPEKGFVLAYVGRPVKRKGFHRLLRAWDLTGLANKGGELLIAGCTAAECN